MSVYDHTAYGAEQEYRKLLRRDLRDGILAGVLAGGTLIIFFFGYDVLWFRPLATPDFLSGALFGGAEPGVEKNKHQGVIPVTHDPGASCGPEHGLQLPFRESGNDLRGRFRNPDSGKWV